METWATLRTVSITTELTDLMISAASVLILPTPCPNVDMLPMRIRWALSLGYMLEAAEIGLVRIDGKRVCYDVDPPVEDGL
jgi:hypothetical protein